MTDALRFRDIDVDGDRPTLLAFARDLFNASFGDEGRFDRRFGADGNGYAAWMLDSTAADKGFASFALLADEPVGMVVIGPEPSDETTGHVFHYYLSATVRGRGLGARLNEHALATLAAAGFRRAKLHVAPDNCGAIRFYEKHGWDRGGMVSGKDVLAMTCEIGDRLETW